MINLIKTARKIFKNRQINSIRKYKKAAVMILLYEENNEPHIIFEVRSSKLRNQPGDVCLPGGKVEKGETSKEAAVRETIEELNVLREDIEYIGEMDYFISPYGLIMYPFIGRLKRDAVNPNLSEVDHIFKVPLKYFMNNEPILYEMEIGPKNLDEFPFELINGGKDYKFRTGILKEYFYQYDGYVIWGFTAQVVKSFIDIIKKETKSS